MLDKFFKTIEKITPSKYRWILNHDGFKRYFANTGWMFFGQMVSLLISFFIGVWLARYLGPENYGILNYAIAFSGLFGFIASLGVDGILSRELVAHPEQRDELLGTAFFLKLVGGFLAFFVSAIFVFVFQSSNLIRILVLLFSLVYIFQSMYVISIFFQSNVEAKKNVKTQLVAMLISSFLKIIFIISGLGLIWIILIYALDSLWIGLGLIWEYYKSKLKIKFWKFNKGLAKNILNSSWFVMLSSASIYIYMKVDQVMIGAFMGQTEVGLYAVAVKFVEIWYFIPSLICASVFPAIINAKEVSLLVYKKRLKALYLLMIFIAVAIALPSTLLAHWAVLILFGKEYLGAVGVLQIYIWSGVGLFLGWAINQYLISENFVKTIFILNISAMLVNVMLNLILIPAFGLTGAAWATFVSYLIGPIVMLLLRKKIN